MRDISVKVSVSASCEIGYSAVSRVGGRLSGVVRIEANGPSETEARSECLRKAEAWIEERKKDWVQLKTADNYLKIGSRTRTCTEPAASANSTGSSTCKGTLQVLQVLQVPPGTYGEPADRQVLQVRLRKFPA